MFSVLVGVLIALLVFSLLHKPELPPSLLKVKGPWYSADVDVTDKDHETRSALTIYIDYQTGVQYVGTISGGLTPRLDANGALMILERE